MAGVNCGGHVAETCAACPGDNGAAWCHGMCEWISGPWGGGQCVLRGPGGIPEFVQLPYEMQDATFIHLHAMQYGTLVLATGLLMLCFAVNYNKRVVRHMPAIDEVIIKSRREKSLMSCFWEPSVCLYATCCAPLLAGKNYYATRVCPNFWAGCIFTFLGMYTPFFCIWLPVRAWLSTLVQVTIGQRTSCCSQLLTTLFCFPCDLAREGLEIDDELGAEITCFNNLRLTPKLLQEVDNAVALVAGSEAQPRMCTVSPKLRMCT